MTFDLTLLAELEQRERLIPFLAESLRNEVIERVPYPTETDATRRFLKLDKLDLAAVRRLQAVYAPEKPSRDSRA